MARKLYYYRSTRWNSYMMKDEVVPVGVYGSVSKKLNKDVFICKIGKLYHIIDRKSGLSVASGKNKNIAIVDFYNNIDFYELLVDTHEYYIKCKNFEIMIGGENGE